MTALTPFYITGYGKGLQTNKKPFLLPDQAWSTMENAFTWRDRVLKRQGNYLLGQLSREFSLISFFNSGASPWTFNILDVSGYLAAATQANPGAITTRYAHGLTTGDEVVFSNVGGMTQLNGNTYTITVTGTNTFTIGVDTSGFGAYTSGGFWISNRLLTNAANPNKEPNAQVIPGSFVMTIGTGGGAITFTDQGNGTITSTTPGNSGFINYTTGSVTLTTTADGNTATVLTYIYAPGLPGMGIWERDLSTINEQQTIWWDTRYAYVYASGAFSEFIPGTSWFGSNSQFFWAFNYPGAPGTRLFYVTNFNQTDPMYYTDGNTWTQYRPQVTATRSIFQARIIIPYYNHLLMLNTWEGVTASGAGSATNFFNRCSFSAFAQNPTGGASGSPALDTGGTAWRTDIFGQGGTLDAPTNEAITGATFVKNTLIVDFEYSTWQLRYVGEYGLPFIWERISSDFGSGSTFSGILFDNYRLKIGDEAITRSNAVEVKRIDLDIPDQVFDLQNNQTNNGALRIWGIRDYQREIVYWNYVDSNTQSVPGINLVFPNKVLLYNYRNDTWAIFRDSLTCFGSFQIQSAITWDSTTITWDDENTTWDDPQNQVGFPAIAMLNQQGFGMLYGYQTEDDPSLSVTAVGLSGGNLLQLTIPNHNLFDGEIIFIDELLFISNSTHLPVLTSLIDEIYQVKVIDANTIQILAYQAATNSYVYLGTNSGNIAFTPDLSLATFVGGGEITLFPKLNIISKDINLFQQQGLQTKMSRLDFLIEPQPDDTAITCNLILNSSPAVTANILLTPTNFKIQVNTNYNPTEASDYQWFSFYQTLSAQYFRIQLTYDDALMNTLTTHESNMTLYAINAWTRPGGRFAQ